MAAAGSETAFPSRPSSLSATTSHRRIGARCGRTAGPRSRKTKALLEATTRLNLGDGAKAYLQTFDLWDVTGQSHFAPPKYLYAVTLMTKHQNLLLLAPETATRDGVVTALKQVLKSHPSF